MSLDLDDDNLLSWRMESDPEPLSDDVRRLLVRLAPTEPFNQDERGGCVWCDGREGLRTGVMRDGRPASAYAYATADFADHEPDCPWVEARRLLSGVDGG